MGIVLERLEKTPELDLYTDLQVARYLGISRTTVWNWSKQKLLPQPIKMGRAKRWKKETIDEWLKECENQQHNDDLQ